MDVDLLRLLLRRDRGRNTQQAVTLPSRSVTQVTWAPSTGYRIEVIAI